MLKFLEADCPAGFRAKQGVAKGSRMKTQSFLSRSTAALVLASGLAGSSGLAQTLAPAFSSDYSIVNLGGVAGVPGPLGGVTFKAGDLNTLLLGGSANNAGGAIYEIGLVRGAGNHITGFTGTPTLFSTAPEIDGGLEYGPGGVLFYTGYSENLLGQIKPGSTTPDRVDVLTGVGGSVGALAFVPAGFAGAGDFKLVSYSTGQFYTAALTPDGSGTYIPGSFVEEAVLTGGPEGLIYIDGANPVFGTDHMLVSEWGAGNVAAYEIDGDGNPIVASRQDFITGLSGAEGALIDPLTGDFLFSTFGGGDRIVQVQGFLVPEPPVTDVPESSTWAAILLLVGATGYARWRRA